MSNLEILLKTGLSGAQYSKLSRALDAQSRTTKCPHCNNMLSYVYNMAFDYECGSVEVINGKVEWDTAKDSDFSHNDVVTGTEHNHHFRCPECNFIFKKRK